MAVVAKRLYASGCWVAKDDPCEAEDKTEVCVLKAAFTLIHYYWTHTPCVAAASQLSLK